MIKFMHPSKNSAIPVQKALSKSQNVNKSNEVLQCNVTSLKNILKCPSLGKAN